MTIVLLFLSRSSKEYPSPLQTEELAAENEKLKMDPKWKIILE